MAGDFAIETDNLTKYYGHRRGIANLCMKVPRGLIYGFLGPNGAGKTTTLRLLLGFLKPTAGQARIGGLDIVRQTITIRRIVGYLPSDVRFFNHLSGQTTLNLLAKLRMVDCEKQARQLADILELDLTLKVRFYSRGMRQKLGIIQAMMHEPEVLILDEPTNGLDPLMQQTFYDLLRDYVSRGGTVFFSSHIISEVERVCHRTAIIREGKLVADNSVDDLRAKSIQHVMLVLKPDTQLTQKLPDGLRLVSSDGRQVHLVACGPVQNLIGFLNHLPLEYITIETPSLEDVFMQFYRQENLNHVESPK